MTTKERIDFLKGKYREAHAIPLHILLANIELDLLWFLKEETSEIRTQAETAMQQVNDLQLKNERLEEYFKELLEVVCKISEANGMQSEPGKSNWLKKAGLE